MIKQIDDMYGFPKLVYVDINSSVLGKKFTGFKNLSL